MSSQTTNRIKLWLRSERAMGLPSVPVPPGLELAPQVHAPAGEEPRRSAPPRASMAPAQPIAPPPRGHETVAPAAHPPVPPAAEPLLMADWSTPFTAPLLATE
jgi:hypothetical protein